LERWQRIQLPSDTRSIDVASSSLRLVSEYLRRVAQWSSVLDELRELSTIESITDRCAISATF
jgi:hypothetical protein